MDASITSARDSFHSPRPGTEYVYVSHFAVLLSDIVVYCSQSFISTASQSIEAIAFAFTNRKVGLVLDSLVAADAIPDLVLSVYQGPVVSSSDFTIQV